jgi:hypothetical protein
MFLCPNHHFSASFSVSKLKFQSRKHNNVSLASASQWCPVAFYLLLLINNKNMFLIWLQVCVVLFFFHSAGCIAPETSKQQLLIRSREVRICYICIIVLVRSDIIWTNHLIVLVRSGIIWIKTPSTWLNALIIYLCVKRGLWYFGYFVNCKVRVKTI